jgi:hypothetical protein
MQLVYLLESVGLYIRNYLTFYNNLNNKLLRIRLIWALN